MRYLTSLLLLFPGLALSQPLCLPVSKFEVPADQSLPFGSELLSTYNSFGACVKWLCYLPEFSEKYPSATQKNTYCGTWSQMHLVGPRIQTIQKAADPLKSLQSAGNRFTIIPLSDPSMKNLPK